ncbi:ABC transporter ATP-binding protein [Kovacikia minuta CCNUW1]|uniref:ABC transporter ATP-binding protein n=1 Tax=Kovacikia minuta TaxID=2931930 RepID=UPI001CCE9BFD|nr:ABC transporter ATP-binding protein [Kovacikia minuta]UBF25180.1 ABC transporter ATP-binding protein [Kovacikia minuta CCNUW1]
MDQSVILQLERVTRQFPQTASPAVNDITLKLPQGDLLSLLGPSGCGKTTLLRLIAGFESPQVGTIEVAGQRVAGAGSWVPPERRDIGMVFQDYALFPHLTVADNVAFGLRSQTRKPSARLQSAPIRHLTKETIALVGLEGLENRYPHELSGGQQQRVALARALAPRPAIVLLDEPLSNLDVQVRQRLRQEIRTILKATGTTGIFVTHDQEEALSISDWVAVMRHGQIEQLDTAEAVYQKPASRFVAEFVTQANFLPAQQNGAVWETEIGSFAVKAADSGRRTADGENFVTAELMIRQEDLGLEPDEAGTVVIRDRQFLGREHRYCLTIPSGRELHALAATKTPLPIGTSVKLSVTESNLCIFPKTCQ